MPEQPLNVAEETEAVNAVGLETVVLLAADVHPSLPLTTIKYAPATNPVKEEPVCHVVPLSLEY